MDGVNLAPHNQYLIHKYVAIIALHVLYIVKIAIIFLFTV